MKITNSPYRNVFGGGHEKEIHIDSKHSYTIKNSPYRNIFGEGYQQEIEEKKDSDDFFNMLSPLGKTFAVIFLISGMFLLFSIPSCNIIKIGISFLITFVSAVGVMTTYFEKGTLCLEIIIGLCKYVGFIALIAAGSLGFFIALFYFTSLIP